MDRRQMRIRGWHIAAVLFIAFAVAQALGWLGPIPDVRTELW